MLPTIPIKKHSNSNRFTTEDFKGGGLPDHPHHILTQVIQAAFFQLKDSGTGVLFGLLLKALPDPVKDKTPYDEIRRRHGIKLLAMLNKDQLIEELCLIAEKKFAAEWEAENGIPFYDIYDKDIYHEWSARKKAA